MEAIINPVERHLLLQELTPERKLQDTNRGGNELFVFKADQAPCLMREVARLREEAFRSEGGCSGKSLDMDIYDTMGKPYMQLIVWNPDALEIIGGYRFMMGSEAGFDTDGIPKLATAELFDFSEEFTEKYLPVTLELGRSFVSTGYQSSKAGAKAIFTLDNLWDGLATIMMLNPHLVYFFGKVTIHPGYSREATSLIMHFMARHYEDTDKLVRPKRPVEPYGSREIPYTGNIGEDYLILKKSVSGLGTFIPPLINSYINLASTARYFGFAECHDLAGAIEGGLMINFNDIYSGKKERHLKAFLSGTVNKSIFQQQPGN